MLCFEEGFLEANSSSFLILFAGESLVDELGQPWPAVPKFASVSSHTESWILFT